MLQAQPDYPDAYYSKSRCYAFQANTEEAIENLSHTIAGFLGRLCQALAKTESDFNYIRENERFQALLTL